jgi:FkbM family methyltransferase
VVERLVANEKVEGSTPFARSRLIILNFFTKLFQGYIEDKDIRVFKNNIIYYILFRLVRKFLNKNLVVKIYNFKILASNEKNNASHALIRRCGFDDQVELNLLNKLSNENKIFFYDCGSNYGFYSLYVANLSLSNKVVAIEASSKTSQALKNNIKLNLQKNIKIYNNLLSDNDEQKIIFNESHNDWESSTNHKNFKLKKKIKILTKKIDTLSSKITDLDEYELVIKLDIEGNEFKALAGATKTIEKYSPLIIIEFSKFIFDQKNSKNFLNNFLKNYNYKIFNRNYVNVDEDEIYDQINMLDHRYKTIGNYFLVKKNSNIFKYFSNE